MPRRSLPGLPALGVLFLLVEVAVLTTAHSSFRAPKDALALTGLAVAVAIGVARAARGGHLRLPAGALPALLAAYPLLLAISALWAHSGWRAIASAAAAAVWVAGAFVLARAGVEGRLRLARWAAAGALASAAVLAAQAAGVRVLPLALEDLYDRLSRTGLGGNPADMAAAAVLLIPFLVPPASARRRAWLPPVLLAAAAALTQTLTGLAAIALITLTLLVQRRDRRLLLAAAATGLIVVAAAFLGGIGARVDYLGRQLREGDLYHLLSARPDGWTAAAQMVRERPLLGVGAANYTQRYFPARSAWMGEHGGVGRRGEAATHFEWAHCDPLQVVAELGVAGAAWMIAVAVAALGRRRPGDPLPALFAAAWLPFLLLHFPTHLAVALLPLALMLGHLMDGARERDLRLGHPLLRTAAVVLAAAAAVGVAGWQLHVLRVQVWRAGIEAQLNAAAAASDPVRQALLASAGRQAVGQLTSWPREAPWLWRTIGRARLGRGEAAAAETAFRSARALWPHEEAEMGLGLALAAQGRRSEAMVHLAAVVRVNPVLIDLVPDEELRQILNQRLAVWRGNGAADDPARPPRGPSG